MEEPMDVSSKTPTEFLSGSNSFTDLSLPEVGKKRKKLSSDERLNRNRERNRIHARKTRERKKFQTAAIHQRIHDLYKEGMRLRQVVDEQYTASSLLGLSQPQLTIPSSSNSYSNNSNSKNGVKLLPSSSICDNYYEKILAENSWIKDENGNSYIQQPLPPQKRTRRSGKLSPQEREQVRRERNRIHAKKTRDRKKHFMDLSDKIIAELTSEAQALRKYLTQIGLMSQEEYETRTLQELQAKQEMAEAKRKAQREMQEEEEEGEREEEYEEGDEGNEDAETGSEGEQENVNNTTIAKQGGNASPSERSEDNEKISSWSRSPSHSSSSNPDSSGTGQSTEFPSGKSSGTMDSSGKMSNGTLTTNESKSTHSSSGSLQERRSSNGDGEERSSPENGNILNENEWNEGDEDRLLEEPPSDRNSEAPESYHHGRKLKVVKPHHSTPSNDIPMDVVSNSDGKQH